MTGEATVPGAAAPTPNDLRRIINEARAICARLTALLDTIAAEPDTTLARLGVPCGGAAIRHGRERFGWSQDDLARRIGVSRSTVASWETDHLRPSASRVAELAMLLGIQPESITRTAVEE